jgi:hypothetical protein
MATGNEAEIERLKAKLAEFKEEHSYIIGFNDGWDEHVEQVKSSADPEITRLEKINSDLTIDFNALLVDNSRWEDRAKNAREEALEEAASLIEEGFKRSHSDELHTKEDKCFHGKYAWEDCDMCCVAAIRSLKR